MKTITVQIPIGNTGLTMSRTGYPTGVIGLVVVRSHCGNWAVTHVRSGCLVGACAPDPETTLHIARILGPLANWTLSITELRKHRAQSPDLDRTLRTLYLQADCLDHPARQEAVSP